MPVFVSADAGVWNHIPRCKKAFQIKKCTMADTESLQGHTQKQQGLFCVAASPCTLR